MLYRSLPPGTNWPRQLAAVLSKKPNPLPLRNAGAAANKYESDIIDRGPKLRCTRGTSAIRMQLQPGNHGKEMALMECESVFGAVFVIAFFFCSGT